MGFPVRADFEWFLSECRPQRLRTMREFAEAEIIIPDGPYEGFRFSCTRQPYSRLFFDAIAKGRTLPSGGSAPWRRVIAVGPTQSGKTLAAFVIPILYHLFEHRETVVCVVPDLDMADDKWSKDILPVIRKSRYRSELPTKGEGSRGGRVRSSVTFKNGVTLKFMTAGGGDTARAGFTARVAAITELNKFGGQKESSEEADMFRQIQGRLRAYGDRGLIYGECTVTTEEGLVWQEYEHGTGSSIAFPCGHCGDYVTPERKHLVGWEEAGTVVEAERLARWCCPSCGVLWEPGEREKFVKGSVLIHRGQSVDSAGTVTGDAPDTWSLSFRWSAPDNLFLTTGFIGAGEWSAKNLAENEDSAEREQLQFVWAMPVLDTRERSIALRSDALCHRQGRFGQGVIPPGCGLVAFMDLGKWRCHWAVVAGGDDPERYWLVDAGVITTDADHMPEDDAIRIAMGEFHDRMGQGFADTDGTVWRPSLCLVDSGKWSDTVYEFMKQRGQHGDAGWFASKGFGHSQDQARVYTEPGRLNEKVMMVGDRYHITLQETKGVALLHIDADAWKSRVHSALRVPVGDPGGLVLWKDDWRKHMGIARSLLSEVAVEEFVPDRGLVAKWVKKHKDNHWLDAIVGCFVGLDYLGLLNATEAPPTPSRPAPAPQPREAGGRVLGEIGFGGALSRD